MTNSIFLALVELNFLTLATSSRSLVSLRFSPTKLASNISLAIFKSFFAQFKIPAPSKMLLRPLHYLYQLGFYPAPSLLFRQLKWPFLLLLAPPSSLFRSLSLLLL